MRKHLKKLSAIVLIVGISLVIGCSAHIHQVGNGPQGNDIVEERQWYVIFGLVPINKVNTHAMADGATDYEIHTSQTAMDIIISLFTGVVSVHSRTVAVYK